MSSDSEKERQRLAGLYSGMTPEELEKVAANTVSLTDVAREALKAEISGRGLAIILSESTGVDIVEERDLVMIRRFQSLTEALLAKGSLDSSGIECFLTDDNMVRMDWFISNLLGGVKLLVNREDAESAQNSLEPDYFLSAEKLSSRIRAASSTSAFEIFSGGDMRITLP
jgi:hypothetical protein